MEHYCGAIKSRKKHKSSCKQLSRHTPGLCTIYVYFLLSLYLHVTSKFEAILTLAKLPQIFQNTGRSTVVQIMVWAKSWWYAITAVYTYKLIFDEGADAATRVRLVQLDNFNKRNIKLPRKDYKEVEAGNGQ